MTDLKNKKCINRHDYGNEEYTFIDWGNKAFPTENGDHFSVSCAIVMDKNGNIFTPQANEIKFIQNKK